MGILGTAYINIYKNMTRKPTYFHTLTTQILGPLPATWRVMMDRRKRLGKRIREAGEGLWDFRCLDLITLKAVLDFGLGNLDALELG